MKRLTQKQAETLHEDRRAVNKVIVLIDVRYSNLASLCEHDDADDCPVCRLCRLVGEAKMAWDRLVEDWDHYLEQGPIPEDDL